MSWFWPEAWETTENRRNTMLSKFNWYKHPACDNLRNVSVYVCADFPTAQIKTLDRGAGCDPCKWVCSFDDKVVGCFMNLKESTKFMDNWITEHLKPYPFWIVGRKGGFSSNPVHHRDVDAAIAEARRLSRQCGLTNDEFQVFRCLGICQNGVFRNIP